MVFGQIHKQDVELSVCWPSAREKLLHYVTFGCWLGQLGSGGGRDREKAERRPPCGERRSILRVVPYFWITSRSV